MISLIERAESSPTAVLLERLAGGLDVSLASLFDAPAAGPPLVRRVDQPYWQDPGSGYRRRNVSPPGFASRVAIVEVELPAAAAVAFETGAREVRVEQQIWVLRGSIEVRVGESTHRLDAGDCLGFVLDRPTAFRNLTRKRARYAVVIASEGRIGGSR